MLTFQKTSIAFIFTIYSRRHYIVLYVSNFFSIHNKVLEVDRISYNCMQKHSYRQKI